MARLADEEGCCSTSPAAASCTSRSRAGVPADVVHVHGNNKSVDELRAAIEAGVRHVVVDSFDELDRLDALHADGAAGAGRAAARSRPASTPTPTSTSPPARTTRSSASTWRNGDAARAVDRARRSPSVELVGLHCHIGSNVFAADSFAGRPR